MHNKCGVTLLLGFCFLVGNHMRWNTGVKGISYMNFTLSTNLEANRRISDEIALKNGVNQIKCELFRPYFGGMDIVTRVNWFENKREIKAQNVMCCRWGRELTYALVHTRHNFIYCISENNGKIKQQNTLCAVCSPLSLFGRIPLLPASNLMLSLLNIIVFFPFQFGASISIFWLFSCKEKEREIPWTKRLYIQIRTKDPVEKNECDVTRWRVASIE